MFLKELKDTISLASFGTISQIFGVSYDMLSVPCFTLLYGTQNWATLHNSNSKLISSLLNISQIIGGDIFTANSEHLYFRTLKVSCVY